jgi:hypothetical protein
MSELGGAPWSDMARQVPTAFDVTAASHEGRTDTPVAEGAVKSADGVPTAVIVPL